MKKLTVSISDELNKKLRAKIGLAEGKKGDISKAVEAGLEWWLNQN